MTEPKGHFGRTLLIALVATIGGFLFGFDSGVINGTVKGLQEAFQADDIGTGFNVASMLLGCAVGAFFAGNLANTFGRRSILMISAVFFIISSWGSGIAGGSSEFIVYRIIGGLAVGAASVLAPAYICEIAPAHIRGRLSSIQQIAIIVGLFTSFVSNYFIADIAGASTNILWLDYEAWRWMFWVELLPAVVFLIGLCFIPESPRYLVARGKHEHALSVLSSLMGAKAKEKHTAIKASLATDHPPRISDSFAKGTGLRPIVWVGVGLAAFQQLVGINVVFYYGAVLWQAVGFNESDSLLINIISGGVSIAACLVTMAVIDKIGRKPILLIGSIGMALTLGAVCAAFFTGTLDADGKLQLGNNAGITALVAANLYVIFFNFSWGPVMWVMLGEMFPNQLRGSALSISGLVQWLSNFAITMTFPIMLVSIGLGITYGIYAFFALVSAFFILKFVHETKGVELEDMKG